ncbi:hypothetical protein APHAL10511_004092 [Amanita phalloides]|nr:hypothetical protein APHAL10511_004092 [Amanita phalloides]
MSISERLTLPSLSLTSGLPVTLLPTGTITIGPPIPTATTTTTSTTTTTAPSSPKSLSTSSPSPSPSTSSSATSTSKPSFPSSSSSSSSSDPGTPNSSHPNTGTITITSATSTEASLLHSSPSQEESSTSTSTPTSNSDIHASRPGWIPYTTSMSYITVTSTLADGELTTYTSAVPTALFSPPPSSHSSRKAALTAGLTAVGVLAFFVALGVLWAWRRSRVKRNESEVVEREEKKWGLVPGSSNIRKGGGGGSGGGSGAGGALGSIGSGKESRRLLEDEDFDDEPTLMQAHRLRTTNASMASVELLPVTQAATPTAAQRQAQGSTASSRTSSIARTHHSSAYRDPFTGGRSADSASSYSQESAVPMAPNNVPVPPIPSFPRPT